MATDSDLREQPSIDADLAFRLGNGHLALVRHFALNNRFCPVFEWDESRNELVLIAIRDNASGLSLSYEALCEYGHQYAVPVKEGVV